MKAKYYCPEHKYNPPENSGFCFCPQCELLPEIVLINEDGSVEETHCGATEEERQAAHLAGRCTALCSFCYAEAAAQTAE